MAGTTIISSPCLSPTGIIAEALIHLAAGSTALGVIKLREYLSKCTKEQAEALGKLFITLSSMHKQAEGDAVAEAMNVIASAARGQAVGDAISSMVNVLERTKAATALGNAGAVTADAIAQTGAQANALGTVTSAASSALTIVTSALAKCLSSLYTNFDYSKKIAKDLTSGSNLWLFIAMVAMHLLNKYKKNNKPTLEKQDDDIALGELAEENIIIDEEVKKECLELEKQAKELILPGYITAKQNSNNNKLPTATSHSGRSAFNSSRHLHRL